MDLGPFYIHILNYKLLACAKSKQLYRISKKSNSEHNNNPTVLSKMSISFENDVCVGRIR